MRRSGLTGLFHVETNGGKVYEVLPGIRGESAKRALQAFGMEERGAGLQAQVEELKARKTHAKDVNAELAAAGGRCPHTTPPATATAAHGAGGSPSALAVLSKCICQMVNR